jgi:hypothetical protein
MGAVMPRVLDAALESAFDNHTGEPYFVVTITNSQTLVVTFEGQAVGYKLQPLALSFKVQTSTYLDVSSDDKVILSRGLTILGVTYTVETSNFFVIDSLWDGSFQMFNCHLIPEKYYTSSGYDTYENVITDFCAQFDKTAVFKDPSAAWLDYIFFPSGRNVTLNNAQRFFNLLRQKYFIFATDNGSDEILFYTAFDSNTTSDDEADAAHWKIDREENIKRRFIWRDENNTTHGSDPSFYEIIDFYAATSRVMSIIRLDDDSIMAGGYAAAPANFGRRSQDEGNVWGANGTFPVIGSPGQIQKLCDLGSGIVLALTTSNPARIYRSTDYGATWSDIGVLGTGTAPSNAWDVTANNNIVWVVASDNNVWKVYKSTDAGVAWDAGTAIVSAFDYHSIFALDASILLVGLSTNPGNAKKTYRSTDGGANWSEVATVELFNFFTISTTIYGVEYNTGAIYKSQDSGATFSLVSAAIAARKVIPLSDTNWIAFGAYTFYETTNSGTAWNTLVINDNTYNVWDAMHLSDRKFLVSWTEATLNAQIFLFDADNIQEYPTHNLGYLESTASPPNRNTASNTPTFDPFPIHLKYLSGDHVTVNLLPTIEVYEIRRVEIIEELDIKKEEIPWRIYMKPTEWLSTTEAGNLPSTLEASAPYTPLVTVGFNNNLDSNINNLQAFADAVDDLELNNAEAIQDIIGAMLTGNTETGIAVTYDDSDGTIDFDAQTAGDARYTQTAHDHNGGDGGTIAYTSLSGRPIAENNTNWIYGASSPGGTSAFVGTINGTPSGTSVVYNVSSGTEGSMVPSATTHLAKMRLYNTTRGTSALISNVNTGTNTITLTATVPAAWANGDTITIASQTVTGAPISYCDFEITSGPTSKLYLFVNMIIISTTVGDNMRIHPLETYGSGKQKTAVATVASQNGVNYGLLKITSNVFSMGWTGTPSNIILTEDGYLE